MCIPWPLKFQLNFVTVNCPVCYDPIHTLTMEILPCGHELCINCIHFLQNEQVERAHGQQRVMVKCPQCRAPFDRSDYPDVVDLTDHRPHQRRRM